MTTQPLSWPDAEPQSSERHLAAGCHVASIFFPFIAPLIVYFVSRRASRFVAVHALQAFFEALVLNIVLIIAGGISLAFTIAKVWELVQTNGQSFTWDLIWTALLKAAATWLILGVVSFVYTVLSVVQGWQAFHGQWRPSLISGRIAQRIVSRSGQKSLGSGVS
jgi:uncharacterized membrane protein